MTGIEKLKDEYNLGRGGHRQSKATVIRHLTALIYHLGEDDFSCEKYIRAIRTARNLLAADGAQRPPKL